MDQVDEARGRVGTEDANEISVRLELQADFLAGVWAHHAQQARQILEEGDIEEALNAASQIGDDRLQMESQGYVMPDAFTHGTAAQRARWFLRGYQAGHLPRRHVQCVVAVRARSDEHLRTHLHLSQA
jgi:predicted metalloprotease